MKKMLLILAVLIASSQLFAQQDSLVLTKVVRDEITKAKQKEQVPLTSQQTVGAIPKAVDNKSLLPQSAFFLLFAGSQLLLAGGFIYLRRKNRKVVKVQAKPRKRVDTLQARRSNPDARQVRSVVGCQLQLLRTREELMSQARKLNVGAGELELAWKIQELSTKS